VKPRTDGVNLCGWLVGIRGRKLELKQLVIEHGVDICLLNKTNLHSDWAVMFSNGPPESGSRHSHPCPQGHRSLCCASFGSAAHGGYYCTLCFGDQTIEARGGLPFAH
jgi:hypothetical protein